MGKSFLSFTRKLCRFLPKGLPRLANGGCAWQVVLLPHCISFQRSNPSSLNVARQAAFASGSRSKRPGSSRLTLR